MLGNDITAKAVEESAKTLGKGVDAARSVGGLFKELAQEKIGMHTDRVKTKRFKQQVDLTLEMLDKAKTLGYEGKLNPVEDKLVLPWLDHAPLEEDETLKDMWVNLLLSASINNGREHPSFIDILKTLSPEEARLLQTFNDTPESKVSTQPHVTFSGVPFGIVINWSNLAKKRLGDKVANLSNEDAEFMFSNLRMLSLIDVEQEKLPFDGKRERETVRKVITTIRLTVRGRKFLQAVTIKDIEQT